MARRLASNVMVMDPDSGAPVVFEAGDVPPSWTADLIGDHAFEPEVAEVAANDPGEGVAPAGSGEPPRGGPGSGRDAWAAYAAELGVEVDDDMVRDDIIAAIEAQA